ncbi:CAP domain-containing protein [Bacillus benzoevorans]|uniref:Putative YkwD family protein n=1 Tax=Bacillus benzoevorans TaxID=1456 RepID=A0A7X0HRY1_9BACI|nr:putative YkwD family protein [Bacillus benzoevorans]
MIKKKLGLFIAPALVLGLAACNKDNDNAMDHTDGNRINTSTTTNVDNNLYRVNNRYPFDHQGPLTEDYNNDNDRRYNRNGTRLINTTDNNRDNGDRTSFRNRVQNNVNVNNWRNNDRNPNISSYQTTKNSTNYPQTRAVLVQEARYQFVPVDPNQNSQKQLNLRQGYELVQTPELQQRMMQQAQALLQQQQAQRQQAQAPQQQAPQQQAQAPQQQTQNKPAPAAQQTQTPANVSQAVQQVIDLTNQQRKQNGLPALQADTKLNSVAQKKSEDMQQKGYFSHTSPTYGSPFDMMRDFGVTYRSAGENIAQGQRTPQEVVQAWMNSEGHRKNILSRDFTHIGVGYDPAGHHWTQMFIGK